MQANERYETVVDAVAGAKLGMKYWVLLPDFATADFEQRVERLEACFGLAAKCHDDEGGQRFASWIFHNLADVILRPHLTEHDGHWHWPAYTSNEFYAVQKSVQHARAQQAMALWPILPTCQPGTHYDRERGNLPKDFPTLLGTRKALLTAIADQWRGTSDEDEADKLFGFLTGLRMRFREEKDILQSVIREATDHSFKVERLARHLATMAPDLLSCSNDGIARILAAAWTRNSQLEVMSLQLGAVLPLYGCLPEVYALVQRMAVQAVKIEGEALILRDAISKEGPTAKLRGATHQLTLGYPWLGIIEVCSELKLDPQYWGVWTRNPFDENKGHEWFEGVKQIIRGFQAEHPHQVDFKMVVRWWRDPPGEPIFDRKEPLPVKG